MSPNPKTTSTGHFITLRSIKTFERMSEETNAFVATVYIDGKQAGHAKNDGHGGSNMIHLPAPLLAQAEAWATKYLAEHGSEWERSFDFSKGGGALDYYVSKLVEDHLKAKDATKAEKAKAKVVQQGLAKCRAASLPFMLVIKDSTGVTWYGLAIGDTADTERARKRHAAKYPKDTILTGDLIQVATGTVIA